MLNKLALQNQRPDHHIHRDSSTPQNLSNVGQLHELHSPLRDQHDEINHILCHERYSMAQHHDRRIGARGRRSLPTLC